MNSTRYLVRFDDICPTMNWRVWAEIESCLRAHEIRPIVAIVPDNHDRKLIADIARRDFWARVREWQSMGWAIAIHGYQHRLVTTEGGIMDLNPMSEFAGVPYQVQLDNLQKSQRVFANEGVKPDVWVAPWHSFDENTLAALRQLGIRCVSDGLGFRPWLDRAGTLWVPQQIARFRSMPFGLWTVCCHHNTWSRQQLDGFLTDIARYAEKITALNVVAAKTVPVQGRLNRWMGLAFAGVRQARRRLQGGVVVPIEPHRFFD